MADLDIAEDLGARADQHAAADFRMTVAAGLAGTTERHAVQDRHIVFDHGGLTDHEAGGIFVGLDTMSGREDGSLAFGAPLLGVGGEVPLWVSLAAGDFIVKLLLAMLCLAPYGALRRWLEDRVLHPARV